MSVPAALVALGRIGRPHGVRGLVWARTYTERPEDIAAYGPLVTGDGRSLEVTVERVKGTDAVLRIRGVADRDAVAALTGREVFVPRSALPEAAADEYYHHDLVGLAAVTVAGEALGHVVAVHDFGAGTVVEIGSDGQGGVFVPFNADAVPEVNIAAGRLVVEPQAAMPAGDDADGRDGKEEGTT